MEYIICTLIGYVLGCLSPAALISKIKHANLRQHGTKNLGATNVSLVIGKKWGFLVMLFDIAKSYLACEIATHILPDVENIGLVVGLFAIIGHIFPFYMKFKGGKGLAPFAGLVLSFSPTIFLILLITCTTLLIIINHGFAMSYSASILFCIFATIKSANVWVFVITAIAGALLMWKHAENVKNIHSESEISIRSYIKKLFTKSAQEATEEDEATEEKQ